MAQLSIPHDHVVSKMASYAALALGRNPLFVVGSGSSMAANVSGMAKLAIWLTENMALQHLSEAEQSQWTHIAKHLETGAGLEQALQSIGDNLSVSLTSRTST